MLLPGTSAATPSASGYLWNLFSTTGVYPKDSKSLLACDFVISANYNLDTLDHVVTATLKLRSNHSQILIRQHMSSHMNTSNHFWPRSTLQAILHLQTHEFPFFILADCASLDTSVAMIVISSNGSRSRIPETNSLRQSSGGDRASLWKLASVANGRI